MSDGNEFIRACGCYVSDKDSPKVAIEADLHYCAKHGKSWVLLAKLIEAVKIESQFRIVLAKAGDIDKWAEYFCTQGIKDVLAEAMGKEVEV